MKAAQVNATPVKSPPAAAAPAKKSAARPTAVPPSQAKPTPTTVLGAVKPEDSSESSDSSDSEEEKPPAGPQVRLSEALSVFASPRLGVAAGGGFCERISCIAKSSRGWEGRGVRGKGV